MTEICTNLIDGYIHTPYSVFIPPTQCGGSKGKGTNMANHTVRDFLQLAKAANLSCAVLPIDLTKAFDFICREIAMGWPTTEHIDKAAFLQSVGLAKEAAVHLTKMFDSNGSILHRSAFMNTLYLFCALCTTIHGSPWKTIAKRCMCKNVVDKTAGLGERFVILCTPQPWTSPD